MFHVTYPFFSNVSNTVKVPLVVNLGKTSLDKGTARSYNSFFFPNLPIKLPKILLYLSKIYFKFYVFSPN